MGLRDALRNNENENTPVVKRQKVVPFKAAGVHYLEAVMKTINAK